jgi:hypothetical protein
MQRVGDLVVILGKEHEGTGRLWQFHYSASWLFLPVIALSLVQKTPFDRGDELLRGAAIVCVVRLAPASERDPGRVMKIIVPHGVKSDNHASDTPADLRPAKDRVAPRVGSVNTDRDNADVRQAGSDRGLQQ